MSFHLDLIPLRPEEVFFTTTFGQLEALGGWSLKKTNDTAHGYLAALGKRVLVFDGAMGTNL
ncbi:MAG: hypothetical protein V3V46_09155, partial [Anaerolineales bacterium]